MSKRVRKTIPPGWVTMKQYNDHKFGISQAGGCPTVQAGGFPIIPALAAVYASLKSVQPFSKGKAVLNDNFYEHRDKLPYKIADKILGVGKSLGFGHKKRKTSKQGKRKTRGTGKKITKKRAHKK